VATPACVLPPTAVGVRLFKANCYDIATNGFAGPLWRRLGLPFVCSAYFGDFYKHKRALGKRSNIAILATARLMARITWQLLTQRRAYTSLAETQYLRSRPAERIACAVGLAKEVQKLLKDPFRFPSKKTFPSRSKIILVGRKAERFDDAPLIRMEGWGPDCHYGRGPAWPAPQRSVVKPSSILQNLSAPSKHSPIHRHLEPGS
jgi:hypothetical protein